VLDRLLKIPGRGVLATAPGKNEDYVLRCFGPKVGIPEDPATGSAQSMLAPYWSERLGKTSLRVRQLSPRGGEKLWCANDNGVTMGVYGGLFLRFYFSFPR